MLFMRTGFEKAPGAASTRSRNLARGISGLATAAALVSAGMTPANGSVSAQENADASVSAEAKSSDSRAAVPHISSRGLLGPVDYPGLCVRHAYFQGELTRCPGQASRDTPDFYFRAVRVQGSPDLYRLAATNRNLPGHYLRHQNFAIVLSKTPQRPSKAYDLFMRDSAFYLRPGLSGEGISFESFNFPGWYIRHSDFRLCIAKSRGAGDRLFQKDASFRSFVMKDHGSDLVPVDE
ncbi:AbfB domain-containing protein [Sphaerisporangium dianthi]|uniref:AbfB domain-containing protein n=1 Tax=Sphaerisporangium dianthi TaxID=1436120 RepID=A0ABV9CKS9_9ACTN